MAQRTVMTGDFNAYNRETRPAYRDHLVKHGAGFFDSAEGRGQLLQDPRREVLQRLRRQNRQEVLPQRHPHRFPLDHIDYIWTAGRVSAVGRQIARPTVTWRTFSGKRVPLASEIGSDQWPVVARVESGAGSVAACDPGMSEATLPGFDGASCDPSHSAAEKSIAAVTKRGLRASPAPSHKSSRWAAADPARTPAAAAAAARANTAPATPSISWCRAGTPRPAASWAGESPAGCRPTPRRSGQYIIWNVNKSNPAANDHWKPYVHPTATRTRRWRTKITCTSASYPAPPATDWLAISPGSPSPAHNGKRIYAPPADGGHHRHERRSVYAPRGDARGRVVDLGEGFGVVNFGPPPPMRWGNIDDLPSPVMGRAIVVMATL